MFLLGGNSACDLRRTELGDAGDVGDKDRLAHSARKNLERGMMHLPRAY